ncbi:endo alpha-1,4 polygalactosaminidase [Cellulomonas massiliensis]|uniref:endo alpha-1,4 polygalactosaminidase n=1 Tax=Cellulomonas massiliensis TaxID=1465811 RepID=UPI00031C69CC|nr:endo alpha-1,4 polygalactosaminidase [Cellulomonas massiliensis]
MPTTRGAALLLRPSAALVGLVLAAGCGQSSSGAGPTPVPGSTTSGTGTATASASPEPEPEPTTTYALPPTRGVFDYQLGGAYDLPGLAVVGRDATAEPAEGAYSICYVNGFQTQPGDEATWAGAREDLLLHDASGELVVDPDWPDEHVLDPSTEEQRTGILEVMGPVIDGCAAHGFDAVEIDNLDTWTRFDQIPESGAVALASAYIERAHAAGLAIAQKNAAEHTEAFHRLGFDFAVTEECAVWDECAAYTDVYGEHVLQIEYTDALPHPFADVCARPDRAPLTILRDRDLVAKGDDAYAYDQC